MTWDWELQKSNAQIAVCRGYVMPHLSLHKVYQTLLQHGLHAKHQQLLQLSLWFSSISFREFFSDQSGLYPV